MDPIHGVLDTILARTIVVVPPFSYPRSLTRRLGTAVPQSLSSSTDGRSRERGLKGRPPIPPTVPPAGRARLRRRGPSWSLTREPVLAYSARVATEPLGA